MAMERGKSPAITKQKPVIYFSHSLKYYNTEIEKEDLKFLQSLGHVVNPNGKGITGEIFEYLLKVSESDAVWYRGNTIGVAFEVLTALAMRIPVYSLETKQVISKVEITTLIDTFQNGPFIDDLVMFEAIQPEGIIGFLPFVVHPRIYGVFTACFHNLSILLYLLYDGELFFSFPSSPFCHCSPQTPFNYSFNIYLTL
jgi:hypothetical protein